MNIKSKKTLVVLMATFCCLNLQAKNNESSFKVAVVQDAAGTKEIMKGRYQLGLEKLNKKSSSLARQYDVAMGTCVANLMIKKLALATKSCSEAIDVYQSKKGIQYRYLTSVAYSNRAVAHYKLGNVDSAVNDLELAVSIDDNEIVVENLSHLKSKLGSTTQVIENVVAD